MAEVLSAAWAALAGEAVAVGGGAAFGGVAGAGAGTCIFNDVTMGFRFGEGIVRPIVTAAIFDCRLSVGVGSGVGPGRWWLGDGHASCRSRY